MEMEVTRVISKTWVAILMGGLLLLNGPASAQPTIKIGQSLALSGPLASYGKEKRDGAALAVAATNRSGGIKGKQLELVVLDDGYQAARVAENTRALVTDHHAQALLGYFGVPTTEAALPVIEELKIPAVGFSSGSPTLRIAGRKYAFPVRASYAAEASYIVRHLRTIGIDRVAIVSAPDQLGELGARAYEAALSEAGLKPVIRLQVNREGSDSEAAVQQLNKANPQAVLMFLASTAAAEVVKAYRKKNGGASFYSASIVAANQLVASGGDAVKGVAITQVVPLPTDGRLEIAREYRKLVAATPGASESLYGLEGYIEASILIQALKRATSLSADEIVRALESLGRFEVGGFNVQYGPAERTGSAFVDITVISMGGVLRR